jgi:DNA-binding NarL/FixJ family response regulator
MAARILIIDDHPLVREGLSGLIESENDLTVCAAVDCAESALAVIVTLRPDVVVLDLALGSDDGIALLATLRAQHPLLPVLVLSMHDERFFAARLLALGASGYVMKKEPPEVFLSALRHVIAGDRYVKPELAARLTAKSWSGRHPQLPASPLTGREHDVLSALARGFGTRQIATLLNMSVKTVDSHRRNMRDKLGLRSAGELVRYGMQWEITARDPPAGM